MQDRITSILERWFIQEPALFGVACTHDLAPNTAMACPVRCGRGRIEYNPNLLRKMNDRTLEEALRTEAVRILLKHPYERKPDQCCQQAVAIGSNLVISDNYRYGNFDIDKPSDYGLESGRPYEWYSRRIQEMLPPASDDDSGDDAEDTTEQGEGQGDATSGDKSGGKNPAAARDLAGLWEEDELMTARINGVIEGVKNWGTVGGRLVEMIKASTKAKIDWRNIFAGFRASILSDRRKLTRMKPNRRAGFAQMGSRREFTTKLLVAVDVSGSISTQSLSYFYGVVNSAFKYGFEAVDVIEFDAGITKVCSLKKKLGEVTALGRGGTSFNAPVLYAHEHDYDGLLILTDGYAPEPQIPEGFRTRIIWVCEDKDCYEAHHSWMEKYGRVTVVDLS